MTSDGLGGAASGGLVLPDGALEWVRETVRDEQYPAPLRNAVADRAAGEVRAWIPQEAAAALKPQFWHDTDVPRDMWSCGVEGLIGLMGALQTDLPSERMVTLVVEETVDFPEPNPPGGHLVGRCSYFIGRGPNRPVVDAALDIMWMPVTAVGIVTSGPPAIDGAELTADAVEAYLRSATHGVLFPWDGQGIAVVALDPPTS